MENSKTIKVFISQPMRDKTDEEIMTERNAAITTLKENEPDKNFEVIDSFMQGAPHDAKPLWFLGKSLQMLSTADLALFIGNWSDYRGCRIEHICAEEYGIEIIEE